MSEVGTQQLVERMKFYWLDLKCRMEDGQPVVIDLGLPDAAAGRVEFFIDEVCEHTDFEESDDDPHVINLIFKYDSALFGPGHRTNVDIHLDSHCRNIKLIVDPYGVYDDFKEDGGDGVPLIVSFDGKERKRRIVLRPRELDEPKISEEEVLLAEVLFNEVTAKLDLVPETPFDFASIRTYVRKHEETYNRVLALWGELSKHWYEIREAWDNSLND